MIKTLYGRVHGRTIQLDEDLGVSEGQEVEVQVKVVPPDPASQLSVKSGMAAIYAILGERFDTGEHDVAARHNEHQP
jgi:hypothetical protein